MLINCPECGKEVSNKSEKCIHCGYPFKIVAVKKEEPKAQLVGLRVFLGIMTLLLSSAFSNYCSRKMFQENISPYEAGGFSYLLMMITGIIMLCMCKCKNYKTLLIPIATMFFSHFLCPFTTIYTIIAMILAMIWFIPAIKQKNNTI